MKRLWRWLLALVLLPLAWASLKEVAVMIPAVGAEGVGRWWLYAAGAASYAVLERFVTKPMWLYVVGHEMTHAVSGLLSGARIHSIKAGSRGGEVHLSKSNAFIALSPYVFPFYTLAVIGLYALLRHWWNRPELTPVFQFLLGMTLAFHLSLTVSAFHGHQPDLKVLGFFLSGVLILLGNILILGILGVNLFSKTPTLKQFTVGIGRETLSAWQKLFVFTTRGVSQWIH